MRNLPRQLRLATSALGAQLGWEPGSTQTVVQALQRWATESPSDPFLLFEGRQWSIGAFQAEVQRHAQAYVKLGLRRGDVVALLIDNRPEQLFHLYGMASVGVVPALIPPQAVGASLVHAIEACSPQLLVAGSAQLAALEEIRDQAVVGTNQIFVDAEPDAPSGGYGWERALAGCPTTLPAEGDLPLQHELLGYIFTSGTTGLPKPAVITHQRQWRAATAFATALTVHSDDCLYNCLPLCHATATVIAVPLAIVARCRLALARRFSARRFWRECIASNATVVSYVGELGRYLLRQPPSEDDHAHRVDRFVGNGLRAELWQPLRERFGINRVVEFYASTEGNAETINHFNSPGCCGLLVPGRMALARYDADTGQPLRNAAGRGERVGADEPGLMLGAIGPTNPFDGYLDDRATHARIVTDLFEPGDRWFNTGDVLRRDKLRRLYFVERLGEAFRWKGETISAAQIAAALEQVPQIAEAAAFGVPIEGMEGRAPMAAIVLRTDAASVPAEDEATETREGGTTKTEPQLALDTAALFGALSENLPSYAIPRFVRVMHELPLTPNLKVNTRRLRYEGFDVHGIDDPLYIWLPDQRHYVPLTSERHDLLAEQRWTL